MRIASIFLFILFSFVEKLSAQLNLSQLLKDHQITGAQLTFTDHAVSKNLQAGYANVDEYLKVDSSTIFQAASLSKVVLAYICLEMTRENQIDLDVPLLKYFDYKRLSGDKNAGKITARMVLQHSSGLPNWAENPMQKNWANSSLRTAFEPGSKWSYSGEGFVFLQLAIQRILKKDLQQIADSLVFRPLGMKNSSFVHQEDFTEKMATGYHNGDEVSESTTFFLPNAAFSLTTTTKEYGIFLNALVTKHLNTLIERPISIFDPKKPKKSAKQLFWGLGIGIQENELGTALWHWGDNGDFKSFFVIYPAQQKQLVCFVNQQNGLDLMRPLFDAYFGKATWSLVDWLR